MPQDFEVDIRDLRGTPRGFEERLQLTSALDGRLAKKVVFSSDHKRHSTTRTITVVHEGQLLSCPLNFSVPVSRCRSIT